MMPKVGMEPLRREALIEATIHEIGVTGTLGVTVSQIARRAGMSPALAHHYFGGKEQILLAAMRHTLSLFGSDVRTGLAGADTSRARLEAVIRAAFSPSNFRDDVIASWLNFYVLAQTSDGAKRLLSIYHRRLRANLRHDLRPLIGEAAPSAALRLAGLIDGLYLHAALNPRRTSGDEVVRQILCALDHELGAKP